MKERLPSIHIRKDHLIIILKEAFPKTGPIDWDYESLADSLLKKARKYSLPGRRIVVSNDKLVRQAAKLKASTQSDASLFSTCLTQIRRKNNHRGINQLSPGEPDWLQLKEVCSLATEFCNEFELDKKVGYITYCEIAMTKMKNYSLNKFKNLHKVICEEYEALKIIKADPHPQATERAHMIYCTLISERTGFSQGYKDMPIKYQYFVLATRESYRLGIEIGVYIRAQFFYSDFTNQVPDPLQLIGLKAIDKLQKYCYENSIKINKVQAAINWAKIRKS